MPVEIKDQIGTHTLKKTFGYHHYQQYKDVVLYRTSLITLQRL